MRILRIGLILMMFITLITPYSLVYASEEEDEKTEETEDSKEAAEGEKCEVEVKKEYGNYYFDDVLIVNKVYPLDKNFNNGADDTMKTHYDSLQKEAHSKGHKLAITGDASAYGFRSYSTQDTLYKEYVERDGKEEANKYSAKPGHSEHQSGLTLDIRDNSNPDTELKESCGETEAGKWVVDNAHEYGFIIRYLKGKEEIHGYIYEPWHLRYVGKELAGELKKANITLEEYFEIEDDKKPRKEGKYEVDCKKSGGEDSSSGGETSEGGKPTESTGNGRGEYTGNLEYDPFVKGGVVTKSTGLQDGNQDSIQSQETYVVSQWIEWVVFGVLLLVSIFIALYMVLMAVVVLLLTFTNSYISDNKVIRGLLGAEFVDKMVGEGVKGVFWQMMLKFLIGSVILIVAITGMVNGFQYILIDFVVKILQEVGL